MQLSVKHQWLNTLYNDSPHRNWSNSHNGLALQLQVNLQSTSKPDHISELLEETRKITRYFKAIQNGKWHHVNNHNNHPCKLQSSLHSLDKYVHKTHNYDNQVNAVTLPN